jgi:uncharacterized PurR-regulated membrane protein YhhQ (DUF165 family)
METVRQLWVAVIAMIVVVVASNYLVQFPINDWLTWGAFTYPAAFLVTDLTNRRYGPAKARRVVYVGFALAVVLSIVAATPRIALASGSAFLIAQLLDVFVFDRLRRQDWWRAPLVSSTLGSIVDTALFFSLAFAFTGLPWVTWALGDFAAKMVMAGTLLIPFRLLMSYIQARAEAQANAAA